MTVSIDEFQVEVECAYRGNEYLVRDNGAVFRKSRPGKRKRPLDGKWTFGNPCRHSGYMKLSEVVVHRVVATAFHGTAPSEQHVVDHIDTNRRNNRPENLRWITRLDNVLSNPITHKKIREAYGSVDEFLENPQKPGIPRDLGRYDWMRTVSRDEAKASLERIESWAKSQDKPRGGSFGEWLFAPPNPSSQHQAEVPDSESLTPGAFQRRWRTPCEFPACPSEAREGLDAYAKRLTEGAIFSRNRYGESRVLSAAVDETETALIVLCELGPTAVKPWAISRVTEDLGQFCHENLGSCFSKEGADKRFNLALGLPWEGESSIDDFC